MAPERANEWYGQGDICGKSRYFLLTIVCFRCIIMLQGVWAACSRLFDGRIVATERLFYVYRSCFSILLR